MVNQNDYHKVFADIRDKFERRFELPECTVYNQYTSDMCTGFAASVGAEIVFNRRFSPSWLISQSATNEQSGTSRFLTNVLDAMCNIGCLPLVDFPILTENENAFASIKDDAVFLKKASKFKFDGYCNLLYANKTRRDLCIKDAIMRFNNPTIRVAVLATSNSTIEFGENHCIAIVGWNDDTDSYIFQNSLGKEYGSNGRGEIKKSKIDTIYAVYVKNRALPFDDISCDDWFQTDIQYAYNEYLINGTSETTFSPNGLITRAEVGALLGRLAKQNVERLEQQILLNHQGVI